MSDTSITGRTYLVVLSQPLVAQDLALTIAEHDRSANLIVASTQAEAEAALIMVARLEMAFVADAPSYFMTTPLAYAIRARGGRIVLLGQEAEMAGPTQEWNVLDQPFTTDAVVKLLV